jgi:hypothetical protein
MKAAGAITMAAATTTIKALILVGASPADTIPLGPPAFYLLNIDLDRRSKINRRNTT